MRIKSVSATSYFILIFVLAPNLSSSTAAARLENNEVEKRKSSAEKAGFKSNWVFQLARIADTLVTEEEQDEMDMLGFSPKHLASLFFSSKQKQRSANRRQGRSFTVDPDRIYEVRDYLSSFSHAVLNLFHAQFRVYSTPTMLSSTLVNASSSLSPRRSGSPSPRPFTPTTRTITTASAATGFRSPRGKTPVVGRTPRSSSPVFRTTI